MNALIVLLGLLAAAQAVPAYFPHGKLVKYKYSVDVKSGVMWAPNQYASSFGIESQLRVQHVLNEQTLTNSYYVELRNVVHTMHNGPAMHAQRPDTKLLSIRDDVKLIESPFAIVFDNNGRLNGVKFLGTESEWSKNIKRAIASTFQLDMVHIFGHSPVKPSSFVTQEETIHGWCQVAYNVQPKLQTSSFDTETDNELTITKFHEPMNCTEFSHHTFNSIEHDRCEIAEENDMTTASRRVFEIENYGHQILIKKLISHGVINYFPWMARQESHYLLTNQTLIFDGFEPEWLNIPISNVPMEHVVYSKPTMNHFITGHVDLTQGGHQVKRMEVIEKVKKMLDEAVSYLKEDHMEKKDPEWKHGQTINRLLSVMSYMNLESLEEVYNDIKHPMDERRAMMKNIFLGIVPNVGTTAACLFTRNVILQRTVPDLIALTMLSKLPMSVRHPTELLLKDMQELLKKDESISIDVRKASILCFYTLVHKTYRNEMKTTQRKLYLQELMEELKDTPSEEMKVTYLMALRNVRLPEVLDLLEPIIRGDLVVSDNLYMIRIYAILAIRDVAHESPTRTYALLWPILSNVTLPVELRISAYEVLMHNLHHTGDLMNMYWFMVYEKDEHLYNYHVETIKGLVNSVDPCSLQIRETARKILRFTRMRHVPGQLSTKLHIETHDESYGHGEAVKASFILDRRFGLPYIGSVHLRTSTARRPTSRWGVYWHVEGMPEIIRSLKGEVLGKTVKTINKQNVKNLITEAAKSAPIDKPVKMYMILTGLNDNVVAVLHYNKDTWRRFFDELNWWKQCMTDHNKHVNWQNVFYQENYEMHVPTDFGVPAVLATKMPMVDSLKLKTICSKEDNVVKVQLMARYQEWKHGEYFMSIYNPLADTWHAVRRTETRDVVLPLDLTIAYNSVLKNLMVTTSRRLLTDYSTVGLLTQARTYVTVMEDETGVLASCCPHCSHVQNVTTVINNKPHEVDVHSRDLALRYYWGIYNCDRHVTPLPLAGWVEAITADSVPTDIEKFVLFVLRLRQKVKNDMISSQGASCTNLMKIEPSTVYPAVQVDFTVKANIKDTPTEQLHILEAMKIDVRGIMDVKGYTNVSMGQWEAKVDIQLSPGHEENRAKIVLTHTVPGEKIFKICIDGQKDYPQMYHDPLIVNVTDRQTYMKVTIIAGKTMDNKCVRDDMDVTINVKSELSEDQHLMDHIEHERLRDTCESHIHHPDLQVFGVNVPRTRECIREAILHTTPRKYNINLALKKVPPVVTMCANVMQEIVRGIYFSHIQFTSETVYPGNMNIILDYSTRTPKLDMSVIRSSHSYRLLQLPFGDLVWNQFMDNVNFPVDVLDQYVDQTSKICTTYPQIIFNYDGFNISTIIPNTWTLLTAHMHGTESTFAIFVQRVMNNRLGILCYIGEHVLEIVPSGTLVVKVNGTEINNYKNGILVPHGEVDSYVMKLTFNYDQIMITSQWVPLIISYTANSLSVILNTDLQGHVFGLCGSMSNTHPTVLDVHTLSGY
ncbi:larval-specific very high density lipoprotein [Ptiloglossa arizonensis]|uniref:larval-specific very high density lipoprotein n=1 Tax=Ptiloglossa arizonensis TaxID=3350558 RepID=UPI003FA17E5D